MSTAPTIDHYDWKGTLYYTDFLGEREALARSEYLRPLLPPESRRYLRPSMCQFADSHPGCSSVIGTNLKAGGVRVRIWWAREGCFGDENPLSRDGIIRLSRQILNDAMGRPAALANWPFPIGGIAA